MRWVRCWRTSHGFASVGCGRIPGKLTTNDDDGNGNNGFCYESLLRSNILHGHRWHFHFKRALDDDYSRPHVFSAYFQFRCTLRRGTYQCLNRFGDGFRWRPGTA